MTEQRQIMQFQQWFELQWYSDDTPGGRSSRGELGAWEPRACAVEEPAWTHPDTPRLRVMLTLDEAIAQMELAERIGGARVRIVNVDTLNVIMEHDDRRIEPADWANCHQQRLDDELHHLGCLLAEMNEMVEGDDEQG